MKRTVLIFGSIAGAIVTLMMLVTVVVMSRNNGNFDYGMVWGFTSMILAFSMIFVAIKSYRDRYLGGQIPFGQALLIGLFISLIASTCYVVTWIIVYKNLYPGFYTQYAAAQVRAMQARHEPSEVVAKFAKDMAEQMKAYNTWPGLILWTYMEILPVGILASLICALVLWKRKKAVVA